MPTLIVSILLMIASVHGTSAFGAAPAAPDATARADALSRATRAVDRNCPTLPQRLVELFGVMVEGAGVGLVALFESPFALVDYLITEPKRVPSDRHRYFASTESYASDVRLRYRALVEGIKTPACLRAVCNVERLKSGDGRALSAACAGDPR